MTFRVERTRVAYTIAIVALVASTLVGALPIASVPIELLRNAGFQIGILALVLGALGMIGSATRWAGITALAIALVQLWPAAQLHFPVKRSNASGPAIRVASFNVFYGNSDPRPFHDWLERERFDLIALLEIGPAWKPVLEHERRILPHQRVVDVTPRLLGSKAFALALLSRHPIESLEVRDAGDGGIPWLDARIVISNVPLRVIVVHALGPRRSSELAARNALFETLADAILANRSSAMQTIALGDFNATIYSAALAGFSARSGLRDARRGFGRCPTWFPFGESALRTGFGSLGLDIDRLYVSPEIDVREFMVGPPLGSDHRPIVASIALPVSASTSK